MDIAAPASPPSQTLDEELEQLVHKHLPAVWRYLRMCGCDPHTADELTQETFAVALRKGFRARSDAASARFLRRAARFALLQHWRRCSRRPEITSTEWLHALDAGYAQERDAEIEERWLDALRRCRAALSGRRAQVVALFYGDGLSRAEVARRLSMKETGVKTLLQRVRADLRACVEKVMA